MYVCTPQLAGGNPLVGLNSFKILGEDPRLIPLKKEFPLLIVPTLEGWKAEYTLASRMQIHESLTVLALLTRGEARTSDPWICSLMLYHLSYLTISINDQHTQRTTYIHTYIHALGAIPKLLEENLKKLYTEDRVPVIIQRIQKAALLGTVRVCKTILKTP